MRITCKNTRNYTFSLPRKKRISKNKLTFASENKTKPNTTEFPLELLFFYYKENNRK